MGSCHRRIHFSMQKEILANECFIVSHFGLPLIFQPCIPVLIRPFLVSIPSWHINHSLSMGTLRSADLHLIVELHSVSSFHPYSMAITYLRERWTSGHPPYHICQRIVAFGEPPKEFICFRQISKTRKNIYKKMFSSPNLDDEALHDYDTLFTHVTTGDSLHGGRLGGKYNEIENTLTMIFHSLGENPSPYFIREGKPLAIQKDCIELPAWLKHVTIND